MNVKKQEEEWEREFVAQSVGVMCDIRKSAASDLFIKPYRVTEYQSVSKCNAFCRDSKFDFPHQGAAGSYLNIDHCCHN